MCVAREFMVVPRGSGGSAFVAGMWQKQFIRACLMFPEYCNYRAVQVLNNKFPNPFFTCAGDGMISGGNMAKEITTTWLLQLLTRTEQYIK